MAFQRHQPLTETHGSKVLPGIQKALLSEASIQICTKAIGCSHLQQLVDQLWLVVVNHWWQRGEASTRFVPVKAVRLDWNQLGIVMAPDSSQ